MKRSDIKNYEKRRRQIEQEEKLNQRRNEEMRNAVDLERVAQMKQAQENQQRANMYSFAGNIIVANSKLTLSPLEPNQVGLTKEKLVSEALALSQEYFKQLKELDERLVKEQEAKAKGEENGSGRIVTG